MPRCFACIHCGKCGPASSDAKVRPRGYCAFCGTQNSAEDVRCATCGKPLPLPPGAARPQGGQPPSPPSGLRH